ncbi:hypothetical protein P3W53_25460 [Pseudomonas denitrificans (nom. rej.)]|nr:hypothetical protein [Pseudomonas denitrificans (nom. rej.)]
MSTYITRKDSRYLYRRRFPKDVAKLLGRTELKRALGTADRAEALRMARALSVEFDRICHAALNPPPAAAAEPSLKSADDILMEMQAAVRMIQRDALERMQSPGWQKEFEWRKIGLAGHVAGKMPQGVQIHPAVAGAALRALEAVERGEIPDIHPERVPEREGATERSGRQRVLLSTGEGRATRQEASEALEQYCSGVSLERGRKARSVLSAALEFPASPVEVQQQLEAYCVRKEAEGLKPASIRTAVQVIKAVMQELPGFEEVDLPKRSTVRRTLKGAGAMSVLAREPVPPAVLTSVLGVLDSEGNTDAAAAIRILSRYGLRPTELLRASPDDIRKRTDVLGETCTVFIAGEKLRKTTGSRRALPIHPDDLPLFKLVLAGLGLDADCSARELEARGTVRSSDLTKTFQAAAKGKGTLYGLRHLFADVARAVGASDQEVGGLLGHQNRGGGVTAIYGGSQPLTRATEILTKVRETLRC